MAQIKSAPNIRVAHVKTPPGMRVATQEMPLVAFWLPRTVPNETVATVKSVGQRLAEHTGFQVKGQKYLIAMMKTITAYGVAEFERLSETNPQRALEIAKSIQVPEVLSIQGRDEFVVRMQPLKAVIESLAMKEGDRLAQKFAEKYSGRINITENTGELVTPKAVEVET